MTAGPFWYGVIVPFIGKRIKKQAALVDSLDGGARHNGVAATASLATGSMDTVERRTCLERRTATRARFRVLKPFRLQEQPGRSYASPRVCGRYAM